jgi:hypothetical protein
MGIQQIPAASAGSKTLKKVTLTSGSSYTVPAGVTEINVTLYGGGGGGGGGTSRSPSGNATSGGTGGTTSFTGATSAIGGNGGAHNSWNNAQNGTDKAPRIGDNQTANSGLGAMGGSAICDVNTGYHYTCGEGTNGQIISSTLSVTPNQSIGYSIGGGGSAGARNGITGCDGGNGGSGKIDVEYWS